MQHWNSTVFTNATNAIISLVCEAHFTKVEISDFMLIFAFIIETTCLNKKATF